MTERTLQNFMLLLTEIAGVEEEWRLGRTRCLRCGISVGLGVDSRILNVSS